MEMLVSELPFADASCGQHTPSLTWETCVQMSFYGAHVERVDGVGEGGTAQRASHIRLRQSENPSLAPAQPPPRSSTNAPKQREEARGGGGEEEEEE